MRNLQCKCITKFSIPCYWTIYRHITNRHPLGWFKIKLSLSSTQALYDWMCVFTAVTGSLPELNVRNLSIQMEYVNRLYASKRSDFIGLRKILINIQRHILFNRYSHNTWRESCGELLKDIVRIYEKQVYENVEQAIKQSRAIMTRTAHVSRNSYVLYIIM